MRILGLLLAAVLALPAAEIDGKWRLSCDTEAGIVEVTYQFRAAGEKLLLSRDGNEKVIGTYKEAKIYFSIPDGLPDVGFSADLVVDAALKHGKIVGEYVFLDYAGRIVGTRIE